MCEEVSKNPSLNVPRCSGCKRTDDEACDACRMCARDRKGIYMESFLVWGGVE